MKIHKNDNVMVIAGNSRGKSGKVLKVFRDEQRVIIEGVNIIKRVSEEPLRRIAINAGVEGSIVVGKVLENKADAFGFDAQSEAYVDMVDAGLVDPTKVVRTALQDAASVAALLITTEAMVADRPKKESAGGMPGGGMPGGMGDMDF